ncbi:MAG: terminase large subunit [Elusimicrobiales bacterium]|nr:terminase large subunit [Elusimicrobiales bacterium]
MAKRWVRPQKPQRITTEGGRYYFDEDAANHAVEFFEKWLVHTEGEWADQPFKLMDWQREEIIRPLFGWKVKKTGFRRFKRAYIEIPKKNGKSELASGIGLYLLVADNEARAMVYAAATCEDQARLVFDGSRVAVESSRLLSMFCEVKKSQILVPLTKSVYQVLSKAAESKHGLKPSGVIIDELHAFKRPDLYNVLTEGATDVRRQPIIFVITTAGNDKTSIGWQEHQHAVDILNGESTDEETLVVIYAAEPQDDWKDPAVWRKANPSLGVIFSEDKIRHACDSAREQPAKQNSFKQLRLNIWNSVSSRWLSQSAWEKCRGVVTEEEMRGRPCWLGMDLASTQDIAALVALFDLDDRLAILPYFFVPRDNIEAREKGDAERYKRWVQDGHLIATDGPRIHFPRIKEKIHELKGIFNIRRFGYDNWNAQQLTAELEEEGELEMIPVAQGTKLSHPAKIFETWIADGKLIHPGNPVLDWMAGNVEVITSSLENIQLVKPFKQGSSTQRIDGIVAAVMAAEVYLHRDKDEDDCPYEKHGVRRLG